MFHSKLEPCRWNAVIPASNNLGVHCHRVIFANVTTENATGQLVLDLTLNHALHWAGTKAGVISKVPEVLGGCICDVKLDLALLKALLHALELEDPRKHSSKQCESMTAQETSPRWLQALPRYALNTAIVCMPKDKAVPKKHGVKQIT